MRISNVRRLCCPVCREHYAVNSRSTLDDSIETGLLTCPRCCITIPILNGFPIFQEQFLIEPEDLTGITERVFGKPGEYAAFLNLKRDRPVYDLYAAFQPFNESTQSIFPLVPLLRELLHPGDLILDLWCRTGWTGELLAALFPDQQVISIWEGTSGLLGPKGFHFWLGSGKRRKNLDILFHSPNDPLPFSDQTFSVVHGLDTLHRYHHVPLIPECLRVVKKEGAIVFPHNHLTNSEPEPYFDRGEDQMHGKEYQQFFERLLEKTNWKGFVLSEKGLFDSGPTYRLVDEAETDHYNACILLTDRRNDGRIFTQTEKTLAGYENAQVIINPLYHIDFVQQMARPSREAMDHGGDTLFFRHTIYHARLMQHSPIQLDEEDTLILYWASRFKTVSQIASIMKRDSSDVFDRLQNMEAKELIQMQNVSPAMARLQDFYCQQNVSRCGEATLTNLWQEAVSLHTEKPFLLWPEDNSIFNYGDCDTIVRMAASFLTSQDVKAGDKVLIDSISHPEFVFLFWATVLLGAVAVPINPEMAADSRSAVVEKTKPAIWMKHSGHEDGLSTTSFQFGVSEDSETYADSFSRRLADQSPQIHFPPAVEERPAVILFTSGSTGAPKGVVLSHGALFRSARILDEAYHWKSDDRFLGGGSFHTMSGLRNPCITVLHSGASVVIPGKEHTQNPLSVMNLCVQYQISILNVTPAFLAYWNRATQKASYFRSHRLRAVISTGSALHSSHYENFQKSFGCPVFDYYGLTETTGACVLVHEDLNGVSEKGIGRPWGCLIKIIDGELAVYGENLMLGYLCDEERTTERLRNGWFLTGDTARINDSGCVVLVGRKDRMMIDKNGENVYPEQIEKAIREIQGVAEAYVCQYRDEMFVDQIAAVVVLEQKQTNISLLRKSIAAKIPIHHVPHLILVVDELPKSPAGKISTQLIQQLIQKQEIAQNGL